MPAENILVVTVDGLRAAALGAYGNTTFPTPALDKFAAESLLLDSCFAGSPYLHDTFRALWLSRHPLRPAHAAGTPQSDFAFADWFAERGFTTTLITDDSELTQLPTAAAVDECIHVSGKVAGCADDVAHTTMARLFAAASDAINAKTQRPQLVWLHSRGMYGPWDAPLELQESLLEEDDPAPLESVEPPDLMLVGGEDPDTVFRYSCAYAAQVMALDACWEGFMAAVPDKSEPGWLVALLGARGFPLGEHGRIRGIDERLYAEQLHVPCLIRFPNGAGSLVRSDSLVSHFDLLPTLMDTLNDAEMAQSAAKHFDGQSVAALASGLPARFREALVFGNSSSGRAIRTSAWSLVCARSDEGDQRRQGVEADGCELYVRPDDRWEANDVAARCLDVAETLTNVMDDIADRIERDEPMPANSLPEELNRPVC